MVRSRRRALSHWFDGDGLLQGWRIGGGKDHAHGAHDRHHQVPAGAALWPLRGAGRGYRDREPRAHAQQRRSEHRQHGGGQIGNRVFALWEGGSAIEVDPDSLETRGPVTWREDLMAAPFSAHPLLERDGSAWNFGSLAFFGGRASSSGASVPTESWSQLQVLNREQPGYLHAFAMTQVPGVHAHAVRRYGRRRILRAHAVPHRSRLPDRARAQGCARCAALVRSADFAAAYHFADAYEHRGEDVMRAVRHLSRRGGAPMAAAMRGERGNEARTPIS